MNKKPVRKLLKVDEVLNHCRILNGLLGSYISQEDKASICTVIENLLFSINRYKGYNNIYWTNIGYRDWCRELARITNHPLFSEEQKKEKLAHLQNEGKTEYIMGQRGAEEKRINNTKFTDCSEGEYSRHYYI